MSVCGIYCGVFGDWGWECIDADGRVVDESREVFETYEECMADALGHGWLPVPRSLPVIAEGEIS